VFPNYDFTTCIKKDGTLWAWGSNKYGKVGDGTIIDRYDPVKIMDNVVYTTSTFALKADSTLWGWGDNSLGQLAQEPGPLGLPVRIQVEYPAWPEEEEKPAEEVAPPEEEAEPEQEAPAAVAERGSPLPFIIGCGVIVAGGITAFILWRKKRKGAVSEWSKP
jgi:hypothetical protein